MNVTGKIQPLRDNVLVSDMDFGMQQTSSGIFVTSDDGKTSGIHPRWGKVFAIGPNQKDVKVGEWVLVEHGRWTRTIKYETDTGDIVDLRMVETESIMAVSDEKPNDIYRSS